MARSMIARQNIKLNLVPGGVPPVLNVSQYDSAYDVHFTIYNGAQLFEIPDDVSIQFQETKRDGNGFTVGATKSAQTGQCYIWMQEQMSAVPGDQICELVLTNTTEDQIGTANFIMRVEPAALSKNTVISESEIAYANQVLAQLGSVAAYKAQLDAQGNEIDQLNTNLAAEVAARQAADNTLQSNINSEASTRATADAALQSQINQLVAPEGSAPSAAEIENARVGADGTVYQTLGDAIRGQVTDVKTALDQATDVTGVEFDIANKVTFTNGRAHYYSQKYVATSSARSVTNYISCAGYDVLRVSMAKVTSSGSNYGLAFFDADQNYISGVKEYTGAESETSQVRDITIPSNATQFRTTWYNTTGQSYADNTFVCILIKNAEYADRSEFEKIESDYAETKTAVKSIENFVGSETDISDRFSFTDGRGVYYTNGTTGTSTARSYTPDYIDISGFNKLRITMIITTNASLTWGLAFYNSEKTYISGVKEHSSETGGFEFRDIIVPENAVYIRTSWTLVSSESFDLFSCIGIITGTLNTRLDNTTAVAIMPQYVTEMSDTVTKVQKCLTSPAIVFPTVTDIHRYSVNADGVQNFDDMINNIKEFSNQVKCDFVLNLGDLTDGNQTQDVTLSRNLLCLKQFKSIGLPYFFANGNHDTNYAGSSGAYLFDLKQIFLSYFSASKDIRYNKNENATDYYIDFEWLNVRLIVLNANSPTNGNMEYAYGSSTAAWLVTALQTDKKVLIAVHQSPVAEQVPGVGQANVQPIRDALGDFISGGGYLIQLNGHTHRDIAFISPWLAIQQVCQRFTTTDGSTDPGAWSESNYIDQVVVPGRNKELATKDAWSVNVFKPDEDELDSIRFGAGADRYFHVTPISPTTLTTKFSGTVTWSSSDTAVATVADGVVTGVASGKCAIIAKDEDGNIEVWVVEVS